MWPDNLPAVNLFIALATQWRVGMGGVVGLDYNVLFHKMDRMALGADAFDAVEDDVRVMEEAAMEAMRKRQ